MKLETDAQRRAYLALTDTWQPTRELAETAGIPMKGAGTVLRSLHERGHAERRDGGRSYEWRRTGAGAA